MSPGAPPGPRGSSSRMPQFGDGILFRLSNHVYWAMATELWFVVASLPLLVADMFLQRDASNAILYALAGSFLGPALAATLYCVRKIMREQDLDPTRDFLRGYRLNVTDTVRFWAPAIAVLTILMVDLRVLETRSSAVDSALQVAVSLVAVLVALWLMNMLAISTSFNFRQRDLARLSVFYLGKQLRVTLGNLATLFLAAVMLYATSDWVLVLCGSLFVYLFALNTAGLVAEVEARFTSPAGDASAAASSAE